MKRIRNLIWPPGEQGSIAPIVALGLLAFCGFMALSIDMGQLFVVRNELQNVADSAALAAAKQLVQPDANMNAVVNCGGASTAAINTAARNSSLGEDSLVIGAGDVVVGQWDLASRQFIRTGCDTDPMKVNAVQVTVNRGGGAGGNPAVATYFGNVLGLGTSQSSSATATAYLGLAGTSSLDIPVSLSSNYPAGGTPLASNGMQRLLDKMGPQPAYAANPQTYKFKDLGGNPPPTMDTTRATFVVPSSGEVSLSDLQGYVRGPGVTGGKRFPQVKVGQRIYPASEYNWGGNVKSLFTLMQTRYTAMKNASGKWRVTLPVYSINPVTAALPPQNSWLMLASQLIPGVSQAQACQGYTSPVVYIQGFMDVDVTGVNTDGKCASCNTGTNQVTDSNSCRNLCFMNLEVPLTTNTVTTDKGGNPTPYQHTYQTMNGGGSNVGVFAAVPRIVK